MNVQNLHIKTNSSVSLPIWTCSLDGDEEGESRWAGLKAVEDQVVAANEMQAAPPLSDSEEHLNKRSKKRGLAGDDEKPKKKVKSLGAATTTKDKISESPKLAKPKLSESPKLTKPRLSIRPKRVQTNQERSSSSSIRKHE